MRACPLHRASHATNSLMATDSESSAPSMMFAATAVAASRVSVVGAPVDGYNLLTATTTAKATEEHTRHASTHPRGAPVALAKSSSFTSAERISSRESSPLLSESIRRNREAYCGYSSLGCGLWLRLLVNRRRVSIAGTTARCVGTSSVSAGEDVGSEVWGTFLEARPPAWLGAAEEECLESEGSSHPRPPSLRARLVGGAPRRVGAWSRGRLPLPDNLTTSSSRPKTCAAQTFSRAQRQTAQVSGNLPPG